MPIHLPKTVVRFLGACLCLSIPALPHTPGPGFSCFNLLRAHILSGKQSRLLFPVFSESSKSRDGVGGSAGGLVRWFVFWWM